jgi:hypothetical protein
MMAALEQMGFSRIWAADAGIDSGGRLVFAARADH